MKLGILSDIHADLRALEKALALFERERVDKVLCAGDLVEKGDEGNEVVALMQSLWIPSVWGNHDQNAVRFAAGDETLHPKKAEQPLSAETLSILRRLPPVLRYEWEGKRIVVVHEGSPLCGEVMSLYHPPKRFKRLMAQAHADVLILGHLHSPVTATFQGCLLLHPGSVCSARTRDSHTCAILHLPCRSVEIFSLETGGPSSWKSLW